MSTPDYPDRIHFFSYGTKISLELPVGWEEREQQGNNAIYVLEADDDDVDLAFDPILVVATVRLPTSDDDAHLRLAAALLDAHRTARVLAHNDIAIDAMPAIEDITLGRDPDVTAEAVRYQAVAQLDNVGFTFTGVAPADMADEFIDIFRSAVASARMIPV